MNPDNKWYLYQYGRTLEEAGDLCNAAHQYRHAIEFDPDYSPPRERLQVLESQGAIRDCQ